MVVLTFKRFPGITKHNNQTTAYISKLQQPSCPDISKFRLPGREGEPKRTVLGVYLVKEDALTRSAPRTDHLLAYKTDNISEMKKMWTETPSIN